VNRYIFDEAILDAISQLKTMMADESVARKTDDSESIVQSLEVRRVFIDKISELERFDKLFVCGVKLKKQIINNKRHITLLIHFKMIY